MSNEFSQKKHLDGSSLRIVVVASRFNEDICQGLLQGALKGLKECKVQPQNITVTWVPGSFEVPLAVARTLEDADIDAAIALGVIIKGETRHDEYLATAVTNGLMHLTLETKKSVGFGIITTATHEQAMARSQDNEHNRGLHAAYAAVEMALLH